MKAAVRYKYGPPELLQIKEIETPTPGDHEVLVRVHATTVNRTDCAILCAKPFVMRLVTGLFKPSSPIPGTDFAGKIETIGKNVTAFKIGDRVWGFNDNGLATQAHYMKIAEDKAITTIPDNISYEQAAASGEGAHYAYNFIKKIKPQSGQKILVNGATGAIGSATVQLLKNFGVTVTAVCDTNNISLVRSLGADKVFDYTKEDFTQDSDRYHYVLDAVGKSRFKKCKILLLPGGNYISSELGPNLENPLLALFAPFMGDKKVIFPIPSDCRKSILFINDLLDKGSFSPVIDRIYPLENIAEAYHYVASGKKVGNVVISMEE